MTDDSKQKDLSAVMTDDNKQKDLFAVRDQYIADLQNADTEEKLKGTVIEHTITLLGGIRDALSRPESEDKKQ